MSYRRSLLGLVAIAAIGLGGCSGTSASAVPSVSVPSVPASIGTGDLQGFCEDFAGTVSDDWPNIDQSTASELSSIVTEWSTNPGLDSVKGDVQTIGTWLTSMAQSGTAASPPADVETAFQNISAFADANC
jgi:ABC-type glycerol-3-phosphate transport system substrate-binding protein